MEKARVFDKGGSQVVQLPDRYRFNSNEVLVQRVGRAVVLMPAASPS